MTARQFLQQNRMWFFVVAALLIVYANGASIGEAFGIAFVKESAFVVTLAVLLWLAIAMFSAMSAAMKQRKTEGAHE